MNHRTIINPDQMPAISSQKDITIDIENVNKRPIPHFTRDEMQILLSRVPPNNHGAMFQFLWRTGCRITEAISVTKGDLSFANDEIMIRWLKRRKAQHRIIPMHSSLKHLLYAYTAKMKSPERLFAFSRQRAWTLCQQYNFDHPHKIRHSFAVLFLREADSPMALLELQQLLGHSDIKTTMEYLKVVPMQSKAAMQRVRFD